MSYNQKPPGSGGSGMGGGAGGGGGGPPNGPNNMPQVAKTFAGIQQQMQNFVHSQNPLPQSSQADLNAFLQQQRIQNMLKQQQQFLHFQQQMQQQQQQHQQQQQQQHHNMSGGNVGGVGVGAGGAVGGAGAGVGGSGGGGSGEPLALTRTPGAAELLNKTYQQTANGNPGANPTLNQLQQTLQALPTNFVQQLQAFQYQMQAKQMHQQQQHAQGGPQQGGPTHLGQQQQGAVPQGVPPPPVTGGGMSHQQQQQQQKHHQQQNALSTVAAVQQFQQRYLTAAAAQAAASGNKLSSATPPPPPPLTNQLKPPSLPPNTQITPVSGANIGGGVIPPSIASAHQKGSANTQASGPNKHQTPQPPPSISLTPTKPPTSTAPSAAHQQNKFTPPQNTGAAKSAHSSATGHAQSLPKPPYGGGSNAFNNATSPAKVGTNADTAATGAALKSPQSTPVQLTKQMPAAAITATIGNKMGAPSTQTTTSTGAIATLVSPLKPTTANISPPTNNTFVSVASQQPVSPVSSALKTSPPIVAAAPSPSAAPEAPAKTAVVEKDLAKTQSESNKTCTAETKTVVIPETNKKESDKPTAEKKLETEPPITIKQTPDVNISNETKSNATETAKAETMSTDQNKPEAEEKKSSKTEAVSAEKLKDNNVKVAAVTADSKQSTETANEAINEEKLPTETSKGSANDKDTTSVSEAEKKIEVQNECTIKKPKGDNIIENKLENKNDENADKSCENTNSTPQPETADEAKTDPESTLPSLPINTVEKDAEKTEKSNKITDQKNKTHQKAVKSAVGEKEQEKKPSSASYSTESADAVLLKDTPKENEDQLKSTFKSSVVKSESVSGAVSATAVAKPTPASNATKESNDNVTVAAVPTLPAKKQSRTAKIARSKSSTTVSETKTPDKPDERSTPAAARTKRKPKVESFATDTTPSTPKDVELDRKSKRHRLKTILYQSPLPELAFITKLSASEASNSPKPMSNEDRLIVFYKNEYMAVRNAEGTFYLCQTMQNVYRTSPRISIRWLSEDPKDSNVYIPDFYDHTDIECVLTTVELKRIDKGHMRLPKTEKTRIESILKKAIDVETGLVPRPELTEENPDGLDISLFKDESQIEKKSLSTTDDTTGMSCGSTSVGRKSRRGNANASSVAKPAAQTPSTTAGNKRKRSGAGLTAAASSLGARKSPSKKRRTLVKRKKKKSNDSDDGEDDDEETSDDFESDTEYKPTQKRSSLNASASKSTPRAQRSPLAKARAASPITPTTSRTKNVPQKTTPTPSPSTSKAARGERAAKRKSLTDAGSSEDTPPPAKRPATTSASSTTKATNKTKTSETLSLEVEEDTPVKNACSDSKTSETTVTVTATPNSSTPACSVANSPVSGSNGANSVGNRTPRSRK